MARATDGSNNTSEFGPNAVVTASPGVHTLARADSTDGGVTFGASGSATPGTSLVYKIVATNTNAYTALSVSFSNVVP